MTSTITKPELDEAHGITGGATRSTHVSRLLSRSNAAGASDCLTPEIVRKMRRHYQVASGLIVQSLPLIRANWSIECEDDAIREKLTLAYKRVAFSIHRSMARAMVHGYSPNTMTWTYLEDLRIIAPTEIVDLEPHTCKPLTDDDGRFDGFGQLVTGTIEEYDPIYCLWITEGMESRNYYGRSILDAALDPWQDYAAVRAFHARYLERFGEPVVMCRAPSGKSIANAAAIQQIVIGNGDKAPGDVGYVDPPAPILEDNLDAALAMGENLRHHSVVALPSSLLFGADGKPTGYAWNLEFLEAKSGGSSDFLDTLKDLAQRISRAMFVPDLLTSNTEDTGSNALGQTHKGVWAESVEGRLDDYSRQITEQYLEPVRLLNFPGSSTAARLVFEPLVDEERERMWALVVALAEGGDLPIDGRELAERYDLPLLDENEVADRQAAADAAAAEAAAQAAATAAVDEELRRRSLFTLQPPAERPVAVSTPQETWTTLFAAENPVEGLPDWRLPQSYNPPAFRRALNAREQRVGFAKLEDLLNATEESVLEVLDAVLDREHDRILRQISGIVRKGSAAEVIAALGTLEIKGGPEVVRAWSELMSAVGSSAVDGLRSELEGYADSIKDLGPESRALFKAYATTSSDRVIGGLLTETRLQLLNAYTSGVSRAGMSAIVGQIFDSYAGSEAKPVRLTTRMLSAKSLNYSRAAAVERAGIPLAGAQYSAILDRRTCELCEDLDEKVIAIESTDLSRFTPPVHHNCRCVWVWILRDEPDFTPTWTTPSKTKVDRFGGLVF